MQFQEVRIDKLVHGGQGIGVLPDGRKVFVWGVLPGERVSVRITKKRRDYAEGVAEKILEPSKERIEPLDEAYLSTSPWQIMDFATENKYKSDILKEAFSREGILLPQFTFIAAGKAGPVRFSESEFISEGPMENPPGVFHYRNKMEYSFWANDDGLHLALFHRASHGKRIVPGSSIARAEIDEAAHRVLNVLNKHNIRGSQLKTIVLRVSKTGNVAAALFVKDEKFPQLSELEDVSQGIAVYYSTPKSPASVITKELYRYGDITLTDKILGTDISYDVNSFFQVNLPVFEAALKRIDYFSGGTMNKVDLYSGVGTIGIPIGGTKVLVESDAHNVEMARRNVGQKAIKVVHAPSEKALDYITPDACVIVDPPRAGLHTNLVDRLLAVRPPQIIYLSCNPSTQVRDIARLQAGYDIQAFEGYNFFPRTPHIESLAVLAKK